jgi:hypothetical protein
MEKSIWRRMKSDSDFSLYTKMILKWIEDLNIKTETIKLVEKNIRSTLCH